MNQDLKSAADKIKKLAKAKGKGFAVKKTLVPHIIIVACDSRAGLLMLGEHEVYGEMIAHFKINLKKWHWAEAEGFVGENFSEIMFEVIEAVNYPSLLDYLIYDR